MAAHPWAKSRNFTSLFIGGGTPTVFELEPLADLIETCLDAYTFVGGDGNRQKSTPEVTLEVNPNTVSLEKLKGLRQAGVNRLSVGIQSFSDSLLKIIGRSHSASEGERAVQLAAKAGFDNINLDLMYGLPHQEFSDWRNSLQRALALPPTHLSLYELMVEDGTPFARLAQRGKLPLPHENTVLRMNAAARELLQAKGYYQYEISNFARPGYQCRHNINYWENGAYLGLGAGAVSCFTGLRIRNIADPLVYTEIMAKGKFPFHDGECLPLPAGFRETVIMGLRMTAGVSNHSLFKRFGLTPAAYYGTTIEELHKQQLIETDHGHLKLTRRGRPLANQVMAELV